MAKRDSIGTKYEVSDMNEDPYDTVDETYHAVGQGSGFWNKVGREVRPTLPPFVSADEKRAWVENRTIFYAYDLKPGTSKKYGPCWWLLVEVPLEGNESEERTITFGDRGNNEIRDDEFNQMLVYFNDIGSEKIACVLKSFETKLGNVAFGLDPAFIEEAHSEEPS